MSIDLKKHFSLENIALLLLSISVYAGVFFNLEFRPTEELMFLYPDSKSYMGVGQWLIGNVPTEEVSYWLSVRPFLYPIIVLITTSIGGFKALWFVQFIFWICSFFFVFKAIKLLSSRIWAWIGAVIYLANFSTIPATFHALTETVTLMLLTYLFYIIIKHRTKLFELKTFHKVLAILVVMVLIKPVFSIPIFAILITGLILHYKKYLKMPKKLAVLLLILLPMIGQMSFIKYQFDAFKVSTISDHTIKLYIVAQTYAAMDDTMSLNTAREELRGMGKDDYNSWIMNHPTELFNSFKKNLRSNVFADAVFFRDTKNFSRSVFMDYQEHLYAKLIKLHKLMLYFSLPILGFLFLYFERKEALVFLIGGTFLAYFILSTGVSFYQGDRLVLPSWGLAVVLYTLLLYTLISAVRKLLKI